MKLEYNRRQLNMKKPSYRPGEYTINRATNGWYPKFTKDSEKQEKKKKLNRKIVQGYKEASQRGRNMNK